MYLLVFLCGFICFVRGLITSSGPAAVSKIYSITYSYLRIAGFSVLYLIQIRCHKAATEYQHIRTSTSRVH